MAICFFFVRSKTNLQYKYEIFLSNSPGRTRSGRSTSLRRETPGRGSMFAQARKTCLQIDILKQNKHINIHLVCQSPPMTCAENLRREI